MKSFEEAMIQLAEGKCEAGDEYHFIYTPDSGFNVSAKKKGSNILSEVGGFHLVSGTVKYHL